MCHGSIRLRSQRPGAPSVEPLIERVDVNVETVFRNVDANINFRRRVGFGLALSCIRDVLPFICSGRREMADRPGSLAVMITQTRTA